MNQREEKKWIGFALYKGRSRLARGLDFLFASIVSIVGSYIWFYVRTQKDILSLVLSTLLSGLIILAMVLFRKLRAAKRYKKLMLTAARDQFGDELLLMSDSARSKVLTNLLGKPCRFIPCAPNHPVSSEQWLSEYLAARREGGAAHVFASNGLYAPECRSLITRMDDPDISLYDLDRLWELESAQHPPQLTSELTTWLARRVCGEYTAKMPKRGFFLKGNTRRWLICGAVLLAIAWATRFNLYYTITSGVCAALALATLLVNRRRVTGSDRS